MTVRRGIPNETVEQVEILGDHIHHAAKCYPTLASGVTITAGSSAWGEGSITQVIPANTITSAFDIHFVLFEAVSATDTFELAIMAGSTGSEAEIARIRTVKTSNTASVSAVPVQMPIQGANTRIAAKLASSSGGGDTATISFQYHTY